VLQRRRTLIVGDEFSWFQISVDIKMTVRPPFLVAVAERDLSLNVMLDVVEIVLCAIL